jgi:hypothetical protein
VVISLLKSIYHCFDVSRPFEHIAQLQTPFVYRCANSRLCRSIQQDVSRYSFPRRPVAVDLWCVLHVSFFCLFVSSN